MDSDSNCLFCRFVSGEATTHSNGQPFLVLRETDLTLTFLSAYQHPSTLGHLLLIPKKHSLYLEDVDSASSPKLMDELIFLSGFIKSIHHASNILLNNGKEAGQHEPHVHFHLIPREINDHAVIDSEPGSLLSEADYRALHLQYSQRLSLL